MRVPLSGYSSCDAAFKATTGARYAAAINSFFKGVISLETGIGGILVRLKFSVTFLL